jgi:hypothetical protein
MEKPFFGNSLVMNNGGRSPHADDPSNQSRWMKICIVFFPFFTLITPFLIFLEHHSYGIFHIEIFISILGFLLVSLLCTAGLRYEGFIGKNFLLFTLVTFFLSIQFSSSGEITFILLLSSVAILLFLFKENFHSIAAAIFATFFLVSIFQILSPQEVQSLEIDKQDLAVGNGPVPRVIHLILDEHIGLEGIPTDLPEGVRVKTQLREFYEKYGFTTFGGAYSHYSLTLNSVPNLLNFSAASKARMYIGEGDSPNWLLQNTYFERLSQVGYRFNVWWGHHIDYCSHSQIVIDNCLQIPSHGLKITQSLDLNMLERVQLVFSNYINLSNIYGGARNYYETFRNEIIPYGVSLPSATWDRHKVTTLPYLVSLEALWRSILTLPEGNVAFAHLLLPHSPYVTNADCTIRTSLQEWKYNVLSITRQGVPNTKDSREMHYREYFKQVECVYMKLDELFKRMEHAGNFENSVIIIHGDHGSRIMKTEPTIENEQTVSNQDIVDGYSTLFAVKFPKQFGHYDPKPYPIEYLLREKVVKPLLGETGSAPPSAPFVFLQSEDPTIQDLHSIPYPISP